VHGRPYRWDAFILPEMSFTNASVAEIVSKINAEVMKASNGSVTQAIFFDTSPTQILADSSDPAVKAEMVKLAEAFRKGETNWISRGIGGYETFPCSETFMSGHSLGCAFRAVSDWAQLSYEEKPDAIHLGRAFRQFECRSYKVTPRLAQMAADLKKQNQVRVGCDPVASAFIDVTGVSLWSYTVPTGPNQTTSDERYDCVFKYLPEKSLLLVIDTPEAHQDAAKAFREKGLIEE
jgi:hypothetical protein